MRERERVNEGEIYKEKLGLSTLFQIAEINSILAIVYQVYKVHMFRLLITKCS